MHFGFLRRHEAIVPSSWATSVARLIHRDAIADGLQVVDFMQRTGRYVLRKIGIKPIPRLSFAHRLKPIGRSFGLDRGWPIDRYYIESFLRRYRLDIRGRVLEAGGLVAYARQFGHGRVAQIDIMYPEAGRPGGTIVADLVSGENISSATYDCIILTQVYPFIYELRSAIFHTYRALKPGGVLLVTLPGISQICSYDRQQWGDFWRFTDMSARRLFSEVFGDANVEVESYGNVLAACAFLQGLAQEDLRPAELDYQDPNYQLTITVRATKPIPAATAGVAP